MFESKLWMRRVWSYGRLNMLRGMKRLAISLFFLWIWVPIYVCICVCMFWEYNFSKLNKRIVRLIPAVGGSLKWKLKFWTRWSRLANCHPRMVANPSLLLLKVHFSRPTLTSSNVSAFFCDFKPQIDIINEQCILYCSTAWQWLSTIASTLLHQLHLTSSRLMYTIHRKKYYYYMY